MTDNRTTELLREELIERGIEYAESQDRFRTRFRFNYCEACGDYLNEIEVMGACITASKSYLTPEQAIAAMLGSDDEYEAKMDELLCRLTNGKWSKTRQYSLEFMVSCVDEEYEDAYEKERAELGSEREKELEELVRDMWFWGYEGHMDSKSQDWQMKHIDGVLNRMSELGIEVD